MGLQKTGALALLFLIYPAEVSTFSLNDPKFCYILDVFLLLYGILITSLFVRAKCTKPKQESEYSSLSGNQTTYEPLRRDPERGPGGRRQANDDTYTPLKNKTEDMYKEINVKRDRRNDQVYQGLSAATKDTYDSLHMQPLPPRR